MIREQQNRLLSLRWLESDSAFVSHEWEELVEKLSCSDDPKLRAIGFEESEAIRLKEKVLKVSMYST